LYLSRPLLPRRYCANRVSFPFFVSRARSRWFCLLCQKVLPLPFARALNLNLPLAFYPPYCFPFSAQVYLFSLWSMRVAALFFRNRSPTSVIPSRTTRALRLLVHLPPPTDTLPYPEFQSVTKLRRSSPGAPGPGLEDLGQTLRVAVFYLVSPPPSCQLGALSVFCLQ